MAKSNDAPLFFATPNQFRAWLEKNHASARELWVAFHRKAIGRPSMTWPESVDEALCFGWIDGLRKSIDRRATPFVSRLGRKTAPGAW